MLSARSLHNGDFDFYRRADGTMTTASSKSPSLPENSISSDSSGGRSPVLESEPKAPSGQRKRVPVACERCRKRKIKCSGDRGGGQGCSNCMSAGWDGCQFLRVASFTTPVISARSWQAGSRYHPYAYQNNKSTQHSSQPTYHPTPPSYALWHSCVDYGQYSHPNYTSSWSRPSYASQYPVSYSNEAPGHFVAPTPPYMQPDPDPTSNLDISYTTALNRPQQSTLWLDSVHSVPLAPHGNATSSYSICTTEPTATRATIDHEISNVSPFERILPGPSMVRYPHSIPLAFNDTPPMSAASHRSSIGWHTETASDASVTSSQTSCSERQESANLFPDPPETRRNLLHNFPPRASMICDTISSSECTIPTGISQPQRSVKEADNVGGSTTLLHRRYQLALRTDAQSTSPETSAYEYGQCNLEASGHSYLSDDSTQRATPSSTFLWTGSTASAKEMLSESCRHDRDENQPRQHSVTDLLLSNQQHY